MRSRVVKALAGLAGGILLLCAAASAEASTPTPTPTHTPTRTPTVSRTATSTRTITPTRTQTVAPTSTSTSPTATRTVTSTRVPTKTPAPRIEWGNRWLDVELTPGVPHQESLTFRVTRAVSDASVRALGPSGLLTVGDVPSSLEPGVDYQVPITLTLPEDRRKWPLRGSITIRSGRYSLGTIVHVRGRGPTDAPPTRTPTAVPTRTGDSQPTATRTSTPVPARVSWSPSTLRASLAPGASMSVTVNFEVTRAVSAPQFRAYGRDGSIAIDPSSLPASVEPGQSYSLRLVLKMPIERPSASLATVLLQDGTRSIGDGLTIRLTPIEVTAD